MYDSYFGRYNYKVCDIDFKSSSKMASVLNNCQNEAINGTANWINSADDLYNYTTNLERLTKAADDAKSSLENL